MTTALPPSPPRSPWTARFQTALWIGLVLVALDLAFHVGERLLGARSTSLEGRLLPAVTGPFEEILIQFHRPAAGDFLELFGEVLRAVGPGTTVSIVLGDDEDRRIFEAANARWFPDGGGPALRFIVAGHAITCWNRDRLAVLAPAFPGEPVLLLAPPEPHAGAPARVNDWKIPWIVRDSRPEAFSVRVAPFRFEGGDLIAGDEHVFIAAPLLARNPGMRADEIQTLVERATGRPVVAIGLDGRSVPDHHIGMFVTPLGGNRVAVGDPDLALDILRGAGLLPAGHVETAEIQAGGTPLLLDLSEPTLDLFRNVGRQLREQGFDVVPIPILPSAESHIFVSYNNTVPEVRKDGKHILLPTYDIPALDRAAARIYQDLGFTVHPIGAGKVFRHGGTVRCLVTPLS